MMKLKQLGNQLQGKNYGGIIGPKKSFAKYYIAAGWDCDMSERKSTLDHLNTDVQQQDKAITTDVSNQEEAYRHSVKMGVMSLWLNASC